MSKARHKRAKREKPAVRTTIVGGRPPGCGRDIGSIPQALEVLIHKAAVDAKFRRLLLKRRCAAADEIGLELTASETAVLKVIRRRHLQAIIARTHVEPSRRAAFLGKAAGVMLAALGAASGGSGVNVSAAGPPQARPTTQPASAPATQPTTRPADPKRVAELIKLLDHRSYDRRQAAQKALEKMLPGAAPMLRKALSHKDLTPEQRHRLSQALATTQPAEKQPPAPSPPHEIPWIAGIRTVSRGIAPDMPPPQPAAQSTTAPATRPTKAPVDLKRVAELIRQLDDRSFQKRVAAQKALEKMLPAAAPLLRQALSRKDLTPEQRHRLSQALATTQPAKKRPAPPPPPSGKIAGLMVGGAGIRPHFPAPQPAAEPTTVPATQPTTRPADPKRVAELIKQLDHRSFQKRVAAQKALEAMLPGAGPMLRQALKRKEITPEQRHRIRQALATTQRGAPTTRRATRPAPPGLEIAGIRPEFWD